MNQIEYLTKGWVAKKVSLTSNGSQTVTVDATAKTMTLDSGTWAALGIEVGDKVTFTGFADGGNNSEFEVTGLASGVATFANATGLADVTDDTGVTALITDKLVLTGSGLLAGVHVVTGSGSIVPQDDMTEIWAAVTDSADFLIGLSPIRFSTSLRIVSAAAVVIWVLYKEVA